MAKFTLNIETEDAHELRDIVSRIAGQATSSAAAVVAEAITTEAEQPAAAPAPAPEKPKAAPRGKKAETVAAVVTPAEQPVAEKAPEAQIEVLTPAAQTTSLTPPPAAPTASYDQVKEALISLMDKKSAGAVQGLLKDKFGVIAISQLPKEKLGEALEALNGWIAEA